MTRGDGRVYLRGATWWIAYNFRGNEFRESAKTKDEKVAKKFLQQRLIEKKKPGFVGPKEERWTLDDMEAKISADYTKAGNRSYSTVESCFKHLKRLFPFHRVIDITSSEIDRYQTTRLTEKAARATVNREIAYLRRGFRLMHDAREISEVPVIKQLDGENVRQGFVNVPDFGELLEWIKSADNRDVVEFLYHSAWRSSEAITLEWREVDMHSAMIKLLPEKSKNKKPRLLPITGALHEIIERRVMVRQLSCPFVFHRHGRPIKSFRRAFKSAAEKIGQLGLVPHDMRRSAVRNFRKAGLSESEGMMLSGHLTNSIYKRYDIIDEADLRDSMAKVQRHLKREVTQRKVVPLKKKA
jgi:integrase